MMWQEWVVWHFKLPVFFFFTTRFSKKYFCCLGLGNRMMKHFVKKKKKKIKIIIQTRAVLPDSTRKTGNQVWQKKANINNNKPELCSQMDFIGDGYDFHFCTLIVYVWILWTPTTLILLFPVKNQERIMYRYCLQAKAVLN